MSLINIFTCNLNLIYAAFILVVLLPFSPHRRVRYYGCYFVYIFLMCSVFTLLVPLFICRFKNVKNTIISAEVLKHVSRLVGIQWELRGAEILEVERGAVIVANHQSMFDILGGFSFWKIMGKCAMVSKKELLYFLPFGVPAWLAGTVFVDRNRSNAAKSQLDGAARLISKEKIKLWICPEGTRNKNPDTFLPFKKGAFRVAVTCQVPIIPLVFSPYNFIDHEKKYFGRGRVVMQCMEPVSTEGKTEKDIDSIIEEVRGKMTKQYELLKNEMLIHNDIYR